MKRRKDSRKTSRPEKAILITGHEALAGKGSAEHASSPALLHVELPILRTFVELYGSIDPPDDVIKSHFSSGPIIWDRELKQLTYYAYCWSCCNRSFRPVRFHSADAGRLFLDGTPAIRLVGHCAEGGDLRMQSFPLSANALTRMVNDVIQKQQFLFAAEVGVRMFTDFEAFEGLFHRAFELTPRMNHQPATCVQQANT